MLVFLLSFCPEFYTQSAQVSQREMERKAVSILALFFKTFGNQ